MTIPEEMHKGEKILKEITPSPWAYFWLYLLGLIISITIIGIIFGIPIIIITELIRRGNKFYITDKRVIHEYTFLSRKISSALYDKIQDLHFTQGLIERIVGIGTIHINTAGTTFIEIKFNGVQNPVSIKRIIEERMMKKHKR